MLYLRNGITYSYKTQGEKLIIYAFRNFTYETAGEGGDFSFLEDSRLINHITRAFGDKLPNGGFADPSKPYTKPTLANRRVTNSSIKVINTPLRTGSTISLGIYGSVPESFSAIEIFPEQFVENFVAEH